MKVSVSKFLISLFFDLVGYIYMQFLSLFLLFIMFSHPVFGAASENYAISSDVIGSGGGYGSSENYASGDTLGESVVGDGTSETYSGWQGFWTPDIEATISVACDASVIMGPILGTGQSSLVANSATCTVITNNPNGYQLDWKSDPEDMTSGADVISAYTPGVAGTPETWSVSDSVAEWGGHLGSLSTTADTGTWGSADSYIGGKWLNISGINTQIVQRNSATSLSGDEEILWFGAEVGSNAFQPTGTYTTDVTVTAVTL